MGNTTLLKLFLIFGLVHLNGAIRCYICNSQSNPACHDPINIYKMELTECTPEVLRKSSKELAHAYNGIRSLPADEAIDLVSGVKYGDVHHSIDNMLCQKTSFNLGKELIIVRGCFVVNRIRPTDYRSTCNLIDEYVRSEPDSYTNFCDTCNHNGCNTAPGTHLPSHLTLLSPLIMTTILALLLR